MYKMNIEQWVYRELYAYHLLICMYDGEILTINPAVVELLSSAKESLSEDEIIKWQVKYQLSDTATDKIVSFLIRKGVLIYETF